MTLTHNVIQEAADLLYAAQTDRAPIDPLTERFPALDVAGAYAMQQVNVSRRLHQGRSLVGHKVGLTSEPMQTLLGVDEPDFGYILDDMVLGNGSAAPTARFCAPRVERPRGRPKASDSMPIEEILDKALTMFATVGYDGMSLRTLNRQLGVSHNLIYQRFGTKDELWRAAVDFGFGRLMRHMQGLFDPTLSEPLEQLRVAVHRFIVFSADHPELVALMNIEGRQDTDRLTYIYDTYIEPILKDVARLLAHLADEGVIRPIPLRTFHFLLAHGATAPHALVPLATKFDATSPSEPAPPSEPAAIEEHARLVSTLLVEGLRLPPR